MQKNINNLYDGIGDEIVTKPAYNGGEYQAHCSAVIEKGAKIGKGTKIWHFSHIMKGAVIGCDCRLGQNINIASRALLGNNVSLQFSISVGDDTTIEDDVFCAPHVCLTNVINPRAFINRKNEYQPTLIKKGATLGINSTVLCGNTVGKYAFIGAAAVVTKDVSNYALVLGVPGKVRGYICKCGIKLEFGMTQMEERGNLYEVALCKECGDKYIKCGNIVNSLSQGEWHSLEGTFMENSHTRIGDEI